MRRKLSNERALRILTAAREEFARRGLEGARVDRMARRAGVNKQLLFYYFHSKRGLYQSVLAQVAAELEAALANLVVPPGRPLERIREALRAVYGFLAGHPDLVALITQAGAAEARPFAPAIKRLVVLLAEGQGLGAVRDDLDPHLAAAQALVLMVGYLELESLIAASAPPLAADEPALRGRWRDTAVELVVNGVRAG
ncbi:MAG TPA: TetR/AcrR family transcriptional regulator [Gemmatimonadales bacterium]|nr:TetR/AcrR family transcriptional regulator [Gemmatimonadales bacterium]